MTRWLIEPMDLPVESLAGEPAVPHCRLRADMLRERFCLPPEWRPEQSSDHFLLSADQKLRPAAVLLPLVLREQGLTMLLTRRTTQLTDHAGQISFPGGCVEALDNSPIDAALREAEEEIGLARRHVEVLGTMPEWLTGTGYRITPVVALVHPPFLLLADVSEVAEMFEVPMTFLMNGMHHQRRSGELSGGAGRRHFYVMHYEHFFIWGATAGMLRNLFHFLRA